MAVKDPRANVPLSDVASPRRWKAVTYDTDFSEVSVAVWCGAAGDLYWTAADGTSIDSLPGILAGSTVSVQASKINAVNTTIPAASLRYGISGS